MDPKDLEKCEISISATNFLFIWLSKSMSQMIKIRPHHLLDIIRDFGNEVKRETHPWGASLASVSQSILLNINQKVEFVMGADSICKTCSKLNGHICEARINNELLMRDYNDRLDQALFSALNIAPGSKLPVIEFLRIIKNNIEVLNLFNSPSNNPITRKRGTESAFEKLGVKDAL